MEDINKIYINRCIQLAKKGLGSVSPNPMVGAVLVCDNKIIGEGYHRKCGEAHAEPNAINSVKDKSLLSKSTIYVSLEPCAHQGRTPACADLIIKSKIPKVVIGSIDPYFKVAGLGMKKLIDAGIDVTSGILAEECEKINKRFYTFQLKKRPYIILKWAKSQDGFIDVDRLLGEKSNITWITNEACRTLVHKWRTEEDAFMVGKNTVMLDNPQLTSRNWFGKNPIRICIDRNSSLSRNYKIFDDSSDTIVFNAIKNENIGRIKYVKIDFNENVILQILNELYILDIQSIVVEGGAQTLSQFIDLNLWDEARVFTGEKVLKSGLPGPIFPYTPIRTERIGDSILEYFYNS